MPTTLTIEQHLAALRDAVSAFARHANDAGLDVPVPTCPDWTVRRLIGHQGMVHRWAAANLRGKTIEIDATERAGRRAPSPVDWLRDGAIDLVAAITQAADDVRTVVFLNDAPPARAFWARRQCHETTIHAVDALSAALGRYPRAADTWIDPAVAVDGIDELLRGFMTRNKSRLRSDAPTGDRSARRRVADGLAGRGQPSVRPSSRSPARTRSPGAADVLPRGSGRRRLPDALEPLRRARRSTTARSTRGGLPPSRG